MLIERRSSRRLMNQINVVPYIDVMLVLLVIFMITAPLINPGQIDLPQIGKSSVPPVAPLEVVIRADQTLLLRDRAISSAEQKVTRAQLVAAIKRKQAQNPQQSVVIAGDKNVRYEVILDVMDVLQENNVQKIGLLAKPKVK
jgi:biopolymer transport protein TolR